MATEKIKGRIIRIIDKNTIVINLGKIHGIDNSSVFYILGEPEEIIDPFSEKTLGTVNVTKNRVKAFQVFDKFTIATTSWTETYYKDSIYKNLFNLTYKSSSVFETETKEIDEGDLNVNQEDLQPWKARSELPVQIGDEVEVEVKIEAEIKKNDTATESKTTATEASTESVGKETSDKSAEEGT